MLFGRVISVGIGYLCGMFLSGFLYGKKENVDLRKVGSGNVGTTNTMRNLGVKAGILTLIGDVCKVFMAMVIVWLIFRNRYPDSVKVLELYAGVGCILGHDFPAYMKFKGGKGIASSIGMDLCLMIFFNPLVTGVSFLIGIIGLLIKGYVSMGSLFLIVTVPIMCFVLSAPTEVTLITLVMAVIAVIKHRSNIVRIVHGNENAVFARK